MFRGCTPEIQRMLPARAELSMKRMCQDCRELKASMAATTPHRGLVQSASIVDMKTRKLLEGRYYVCLGCATRWERCDDGWRQCAPAPSP